MHWFSPQTDNTRKAQYAGSWYESNPSVLKAQLEEFLRNADAADKESIARLGAQAEDSGSEILAVIVPHAGYTFSGATSAFSYKIAQRRSVKRVFLLGPSHHIGFRGAALSEAFKFATPLGDIDLDRVTINSLKGYPIFTVQAEVHRVEHSLELQLPFIKHCFPEAKLIPIVIGQIDGETDARLIGEILKGFVSKDDLVVVSSDFTHYGPRYGYVPFHGQKDIPEKISKLDGEAYIYLKNRDLDGFLNFLARTEDTICGMFPCQVLLAMLPQKAQGTLLKYATSRESYLEDQDNSVSYLSIAFSGAQWPENPAAVKSAEEMLQLSEEEKQTLLSLARNTMESFVRQKRVPTTDELGLKITPKMKECFGVFVTISQKSKSKDKGSPKDLRGCIGSIYPTMPLYKAVQENAVASCSRDPRFMPVSEEELSGLELELNILTPPRRVPSYKDIVIGRDGVILSKDRRQAVFLPQVAVEWNWSLDEMLTQLAQKAGLRPHDWAMGAEFDIFQSLVISE